MIKRLHKDTSVGFAFMTFGSYQKTVNLSITYFESAMLRISVYFEIQKHQW